MLEKQEEEKQEHLGCSEYFSINIGPPTPNPPKKSNNNNNNSNYLLLFPVSFFFVPEYFSKSAGLIPQQ